MWNVYGECENYHVINAAHAGAILQLTFNEDGNHFYTASTDKTVGVFDTHTGQRVKRLKGHTLYVNSCHPARRGPPLVVSGIYVQNTNFGSVGIVQNRGFVSDRKYFLESDGVIHFKKTSKTSYKF